TPNNNAVEKEIAKTPPPAVPGPKQDVPEKAEIRDVAEKTGQAPQPAPEKAIPGAEQEKAPKPRVAVSNQPKKESTPTQQPDNVTVQPQKPPRSSGGGGIAGGGVAAPAPQVSSTPAATPTPAPPATSSDLAVVFVTRDGHVQATTPDGKTMALAPNQQVPSGSEIVTDQGRVGLTLPGGATFWVNGGSSLTLRYRGQDTQVALSRGEVAYKTNLQGTGSLAVTATNVEVNQAKAVNMKIEDNAAKVSVLDKQATVGVKGRPGVKVNKKTRVIVPLAGVGPMVNETWTVPPDLWTTDLQPTIPTSDPTNQKHKSRGVRH
ncbi:MAG: FecR domain-containing protein, partial [Planctomycetota bacterium]